MKGILEEDRSRRREANKEVTAIRNVWGKRKNLDPGLASQKSWTQIPALLLTIVRHWVSLLILKS